MSMWRPGNSLFYLGVAVVIEQGTEGRPLGSRCSTCIWIVVNTSRGRGRYQDIEFHSPIFTAQCFSSSILQLFGCLPPESSSRCQMLMPRTTERTGLCTRSAEFLRTLRLPSSVERLGTAGGMKLQHRMPSNFFPSLQDQDERTRQHSCMQNVIPPTSPSNEKEAARCLLFT